MHTNRCNPVPTRTGGHFLAVAIVEIIVIASFIAPTAGAAAIHVLKSNPRYFTLDDVHAIYLTGSHTWNDLQDWGTGGSVQPLDFTAYVNMLVAHGHNFTLLWRIELPKFCGLPTEAGSSPDFTTTMQPWQRTGPGNATDGGLKFDLTKFDSTFFDRLRSRAQQLNSAGIFAGVYLFTGEFLNVYRCPSDGYPLTGANNINGIDDGGGIGSVTMTSENAITAIQDAFVKKVIDTLNDLPNVLWIVSEEAPGNSTWWNNHLISMTRAYESSKPVQHPIGLAVLADGNDATIMNSNADWVAPGARISPASQGCGSGAPACKVTINDSDHSYFGMWNDDAQTNRNYIWENFLNGNHVLFMDPYAVYYPRQNRNLCVNPVDGICSSEDARWNNVRDNLGATSRYALKADLAHLMPQPSLSSTNFCLADSGVEYLVYQPNSGAFTVNVAAQTYDFEWWNPQTDSLASSGAINVLGGNHIFTPPFGGDAVLWLNSHSTRSSTPQEANSAGKVIRIFSNFSGRSITVRCKSVPLTHASIALYDVQGRKVLDLSLQNGRTGTGEVTWDAGRLSAGVYNACLAVDGATYYRSLILAQ